MTRGSLPCSSKRILAPPLGMLLNTISGRPARPLVAYDDRGFTSSFWLTRSQLSPNLRVSFALG